MKKLLIIALALTIVSISNAQDYYTDSTGKRIDNVAAIMSAMKGNDVFKCQPMQFKVSKSGTSIGLKTIKKVKVAKVEKE